MTTAVGVLGFDRASRTLKALLLKTRALEELGLTAFMLTGSYSLPSLTLTGSVEDDLILIDKVIGVKLALGETLANFPEIRDIRNLLAECLRGGHLGGKAGFLQIHMGIQGKAWKKPLLEILREMKIPFSRVIFTHVNRSAGYARRIHGLRPGRRGNRPDRFLHARGTPREPDRRGVPAEDDPGGDPPRPGDPELRQQRHPHASGQAGQIPSRSDPLPGHPGAVAGRAKFAVPRWSAW